MGGYGSEMRFIAHSIRASVQVPHLLEEKKVERFISGTWWWNFIFAVLCRLYKLHNWYPCYWQQLNKAGSLTADRDTYPNEICREVTLPSSDTVTGIRTTPLSWSGLTVKRVLLKPYILTFLSCYHGKSNTQQVNKTSTSPSLAILPSQIPGLSYLC